MTTEVASRRESGVYWKHSSVGVSLSNPAASVPSSRTVPNSKSRQINRKRRRNDSQDETRKHRKEDKPVGWSLLEAVPETEAHFNVLEKIGEGTFSSVFKATLRGKPDKFFALKHIIPTSSPGRVANELQCLQALEGKHNVIPIESSIRYRDQVVLILPYFPHRRIQDYIDDLSVEECCEYMHALLMSLQHVHSYAIMHRDVKPSNFLYNRETKEFRLVDFGLAHLVPGFKSDQIGSVKDYHPHHSPSSAHGSRVGLRRSCRLSASPSSPHPSSLVRQSPRFQRSATAPAWQQRGASGIHQGTTTNRLRHVTLGSGQLPDIRLCSVRHKINQLCSQCSERSTQNAPRAGTAGFRAFEVLLKCPNQTTAIDVWSAGIIFLCLLTGRYPFFRTQNDLEALAYIVTLFGTKACAEAAQIQGKELISSPEVKSVNLKELCYKLRHGKDYQTLLKNHDCHRNSKGKGKTSPCWLCIPDSAFDLLQSCLDLNPMTRITAEEALRHAFFTKENYD